MSIDAQERLDALTVDDIACSLNEDFQFVADSLPTEVKLAVVGEPYTLVSVAGTGILWAAYQGQRRRELHDPDPAHDAIFDFVVRIGMMADGHDGQLGYEKDFGLTYQTLQKEGPLRDMTPITTDDLEGCPDLASLAFAMHALRTEYADSKQPVHQ
jgi:hypothetical protein